MPMTVSEQDKETTPKQPPFDRVPGTEETSDAQIAMYEEIAKRPNAFNDILDDAIPKSFGSLEEREAIFLQFFGGSEKTTESGVVFTGSINLMFSNPSLSKEAILKGLEGIYPNSQYMNAPMELMSADYPKRISRGTGRASAISEFKKDFLSRISDNSIIVVKNIDALFSGIIDDISIRKTGGWLKKNVSLIVMFETGDMDPDILGYEYHVLPGNEAQNLRKFDGIFMHPSHVMAYLMDDGVRVRSHHNRIELGGKCCNSNSGLSDDDLRLQDELIAGEPGAIPRNVLKGYILYARSKIHPSLPEAIISGARRETRRLRASNDCIGALITDRQFFSLLKFAEASARARLSPAVKQEDLDRAARIMRSWLAVFDRMQRGPRDSIILADTIQPRWSLDDVVLTKETRNRIEQALVEMRNEGLIYRRWGFKKTIRTRRGTKLLFAGVPGTGKTLVAEALAKALGKKFLLVNYASLENCYLGETEKNIQRIFRIAEKENAVLLFDEADAMFYSRGAEEKSWSNRHVNVLLSNIERFEGVVILTTNLACTMDKALMRRIDLIIEFESPDERMREEIIRKHLPDKAPLAPDVDLRALARRFPLTGGSIQNIVRNAVRHAIQRGSGFDTRITMDDFIWAAKEESQKSGIMGQDYLQSWSHDVNRQKVNGYA